MSSRGDLYRVVVPYYVAGVIVAEGVVVVAAPILRWPLGKPLEELTAWVRKKRGTVEYVPSSRPTIRPITRQRS